MTQSRVAESLAADRAHAGTAERVAAAVAAVELVDDTTCVRCGYNLRGLLSTGRCPECGLGVLATLRKESVLSQSDVRWVDALWRGSAILAASSVAWAVVFLAAAVTIGDGAAEAFLPPLAMIGPRAWLYGVWKESVNLEPRLPLGLIGYAIVLAFAIGAWQLGTPEPAARQTESAFAPRRFLRPLAVALVVLPAAFEAVDYLLPRQSIRFLGLGSVGRRGPIWFGTSLLALVDAWLILFLSLHLRGLAGRVLDQQLRRESAVILGAFAAGVFAAFGTSTGVALGGADEEMLVLPGLVLMLAGIGMILLLPAYCHAFAGAAAAARVGDPSAYARARGADPPGEPLDEPRADG